MYLVSPLQGKSAHSTAYDLSQSNDLIEEAYKEKVATDISAIDGEASR